jgi:hypothetical protein
LSADYGGVWDALGPPRHELNHERHDSEDERRGCGWFHASSSSLGDGVPTRLSSSPLASDGCVFRSLSASRSSREGIRGSGMYGILRLELREPTKSLPDAGIGSAHSEG